MNKDIRLSCTGSTDSQFSMGSMHGITSLESYDTRPAEFLEMHAQFGGRVAQGDVVVVAQAADRGDFTSDVMVVDRGVEDFDGGVFGVAAEDFFGFFVPTVNVRIVARAPVRGKGTHLSGL